MILQLEIKLRIFMLVFPFAELQKVEQDAIKIDVVQTKIEMLIETITHHNFVDDFIEYLLDKPLKKPTALELFIKSREKNSELETKTMKLLDEHVEKLPQNKDLSDKTTEKKLITFIKELAKAQKAKNANWCPIIYLEDPITKGVNGIKIKNAWEY